MEKFCFNNRLKVFVKSSTKTDCLPLDIFVRPIFSPTAYCFGKDGWHKVYNWAPTSFVDVLETMCRGRMVLFSLAKPSSAGEAFFVMYFVRGGDVKISRVGVFESAELALENVDENNVGSPVRDTPVGDDSVFLVDWGDEYGLVDPTVVQNKFPIYQTRVFELFLSTHEWKWRSLLDMLKDSILVKASLYNLPAVATSLTDDGSLFVGLMVDQKGRIWFSNQLYPARDCGRNISKLTMNVDSRNVSLFKSPFRDTPKVKGKFTTLVDPCFCSVKC